MVSCCSSVSPIPFSSLRVIANVFAPFLRCRSFGISIYSKQQFFAVFADKNSTCRKCSRC
nr:MAG TPA: hypothetical protein [Caudoviricetes sp.]